MQCKGKRKTCKNKVNIILTSLPVGRSVGGKYGREVDIAEEDVEREEGKSDQILVVGIMIKLCMSIARP